MANETKIRQTELDVTLNNILTQLSGLTNAGTTSTTFTLGSTTPSAGNIISLQFGNDLVPVAPTFRWNGNANRFEYGIGGTFLAFSTIASVTAQKGVKNTGTVNSPVLEADFGSDYNKTTEAVHLSSGDSARTHGGYLSSVLVTDSAGNVKGEPFRTGILHLREGGGVTLTHQDDNTGVPSITVTAGGIGTLRVPPSAGISGDLTLNPGTGIAITQSPTGFTFSNTGLSSFETDAHGSGQTTLFLTGGPHQEVLQALPNAPVSFRLRQDIYAGSIIVGGTKLVGSGNADPAVSLTMISTSNELSLFGTQQDIGGGTGGSINFGINSVGSNKINWSTLVPLTSIPTIDDSRISSLDGAKITGTISTANFNAANLINTIDISRLPNSSTPTGTFTNATVTVNSKGLVTNIANGTSSLGPNSVSTTNIVDGNVTDAKLNTVNASRLFGSIPGAVSVPASSLTGTIPGAVTVPAANISGTVANATTATNATKVNISVSGTPETLATGVFSGQKNLRLNIHTTTIDDTNTIFMSAGYNMKYGSFLIGSPTPASGIPIACQVHLSSGQVIKGLAVQWRITGSNWEIDYHCLKPSGSGSITVKFYIWYLEA